MGFKRGLDAVFIDQLRAEAEKVGWWHDVLDDETLLIGVRENYLNVYWQGQALFTVKTVAGTLRVRLESQAKRASLRTRSMAAAA